MQIHTSAQSSLLPPIPTAEVPAAGTALALVPASAGEDAQRTNPG